MKEFIEIETSEGHCCLIQTKHIVAVIKVDDNKVKIYCLGNYPNQSGLTFTVKEDYESFISRLEKSL